LSKTSLHILPSLDDLVADPSRVEDLSGGECQNLLIKLTSIQPLLLGRMVSDNNNANIPPEDTLLKVEQAAKRLNCSKDWLYRNASKFPFTRRISPRQLRFSDKGITKHIRNKAN